MADNNTNFIDNESVEPRRLRFFKQMVDVEGLKSQSSAEMMGVTQVCQKM